MKVICRLKSLGFGNKHTTRLSTLGFQLSAKRRNLSFSSANLRSSNTKPNNKHRATFLFTNPNQTISKRTVLTEVEQILEDASHSGVLEGVYEYAESTFTQRRIGRLVNSIARNVAKPFDADLDPNDPPNNTEYKDLTEFLHKHLQSDSTFYHVFGAPPFYPHVPGMLNALKQKRGVCFIQLDFTTPGGEMHKVLTEAFGDDARLQVEEDNKTSKVPWDTSGLLFSLKKACEKYKRVTNEKPTIYVANIDSCYRPPHGEYLNREAGALAATLLDLYKRDVINAVYTGGWRIRYLISRVGRHKDTMTWGPLLTGDENSWKALLL